MKRVLLTGADGFTGHYLAQELAAAGHEVHGISRTPPQSLAGQGKVAHWHKADLAHPATLQAALEAARPHWVVHLAAVSFVAHGNVDDIYQVNLLGTRNLLEALAATAARSAPLQAVLLASSANVYGNAGGGRLDESTPFAPANDYAVSKVAAEFVARLYAERLPLIITRPFNYTGVGQSLNFLLPKMVDHVRRRAPQIELGNLEVARDFLDVRTVAAYYLRLLQAPQALGGVFNICSGQAHSLRGVMDALLELACHQMELQVNPAFVRANEVRTLCGNPGRLHATVGEIQGPSLRDTLAWMLQAS